MSESLPHWTLEYGSHDDPYGDILVKYDGRTVAKIPLDDAPVEDYNRAQKNYYNRAQKNHAHYIVDACNMRSALPTNFFDTIKVAQSRAEIRLYQSIPHISVISFARALRWHHGGLESWSLSDWYTALAGECGELGNVVKKLNRIRDSMQQRGVDEAKLKEQLKMEIGDVFIYLDLFARRAGFNLEDCIRDTFNRISEREGFPERL